MDGQRCFMAKDANAHANSSGTAVAVDTMVGRTVHFPSRIEKITYLLLTSQCLPLVSLGTTVPSLSVHTRKQFAGEVHQLLGGGPLRELQDQRLNSKQLTPN